MGMGGQIGELAGEGIGDLTAMHNNAQISYLLDQWKKRYQDLPTSERVNAAPVGKSNLGGVSMDQNYKDAENRALQQLMEEATSGGMTAADKERINQAKLAGLSYSRGVQGQGEANMRARGMGGSGAAMAGDLAAQQGGVDRAYQGDMSAAASGSDRALQALEAAGGLSESLGSQDLAQKDLSAKANDAISAFNASRNDKAAMFDSGLAHKDALDQAKGLDEESMLEQAQNSKWAQQAVDKGRGYGKQIGSLGDSLGGGDGGGGGGGGGMGGFDWSSLFGG